MANVLPWESRVRIIAALVEGNSLRATSRMVSTDKNATRHLGARVGDGCAELHNRIVRNVRAYVLEADEMWSFVAKKEARVDANKDPTEWGDVYTFLALDATTKLIVSFHVGKRDQESTDAFVNDLRSRLTVVPHISTDGFQPYIQAIAAAFMGCADYGQVVKNYRTGSKRGPDHRYEPPRDPFITKTPIFGVPDMARLGTSHVERVNLTMRHTVGRTRRLCLAFSKTLRGHRAATALGIMAYNFTRVNAALGCTPAMAAGLTDHVWSISELMEAALAAEPCEAPAPKPLVLPPGCAGEDAPAARELPGGRGWLRVVPGGQGGAPAPASPAQAAAAPVATPAAGGAGVAQSAAPAGAPADDRQLDLFAWRPKSPPKGQLSLFGDPEGGT